jgi:hypothetical protein
MTVLLPDIGRNGLVNSVRRLSGLNIPGYRPVYAAASFIAGMVAKLVDKSDGNGPVLDVADADDNEILGIFYCHKTTNFYRPIVDEAQTMGTSPNTATVIYLNHANIKASSVRLRTSSGLLVLVETTDYDVNTTNGVITLNSTGNGKVGDTAAMLVSYMYEDPTLTGIDQTLGSGMAAVLEDQGEIASLVYDTSKAYTLMGYVYSNASGYLTSANGGGAKVGIVTKVPSAEDPELRFKLNVTKV